MISKKKKNLKIAIDSPAAAGAGTLAKSISKHYNLLYLDTGKIYRYIAYLKFKFPKKFNLNFLKKKIKLLRIKNLQNKDLLSNQTCTKPPKTGRSGSKGSSAGCASQAS